MSPERLADLRRQRETVQAHLNWLDAEIARANSANDPVTPPPPKAPAATPSEPNFAADPGAAAASARQGCLLWAIILCLLSLAAVVAVYYWRYREHPLLFVPTKSALAAYHERTA